MGSKVTKTEQWDSQTRNDGENWQENRKAERWGQDYEAGGGSVLLAAGEGGMSWDGKHKEFSHG